MQVEIRLFATFRDVVGTKTLEWEIDPNRTVRAVLEELVEEYPDLDLFENGDLHGYINVMVNGTNIFNRDGLAMTLEEGDRLSIFPPVEGGGSSQYTVTPGY